MGMHSVIFLPGKIYRAIVRGSLKESDVTVHAQNSYT